MNAMLRLLTIEIHEVANGVLLSIEGRLGSEIDDPLRQFAFQAGPIHYADIDAAIEAAPRIVLNGLKTQRCRAERTAKQGGGDNAQDRDRPARQYLDD